MLRARVKESRGEYTPLSPAATGPQGSCGVFWASLGGPVEPVWDLGRSCGLLGASWAPGLLGRASTRINSLIRVSWTPVISSRAPLGITLSSLGNGAAVAASWGTSWAPGLLGRTSRVPAEAGAMLESAVYQGCGEALWALNSLPQPRRGAGGTFFRKSGIWQLQNTPAHRIQF